MNRAKKERRRHRLEKRNRSRRRILDLSERSDPGPIRLISYDITYEALKLPGAPLPLSDEERSALFEQCQNDPPAAIERIKLLLADHPHSPPLLNWLHTAYGMIDDETNMELTARLNYEMNPDYLFARLNYASHFVERGDLAKVEEILEGKYDLKLLYPDREVFHFTEVIGFCALMVQYLMRKGEPRAAEPYYKMMQQIAPDHPTTHQVERIMHGSLLLQLARQLSGSLLRSGEIP